MADPKGPNAKQKAWPLFDEIVARSPFKNLNPWEQTSAGRAFVPDFETLAALLGVPLSIEGATSRSGVPALAYDVWVAYELRRGGLNGDRVWPRPTAPRVLPSDVQRLIASLPKALQTEINKRLQDGKSGGVVSASANLLGKNYVKQVDVVMSTWQTGPELLISTKRMDSSFGNNAANRVEESYGDAKNLRLRHPQAACGFVYGLRSTCWDEAPEKAAWLVDLLGKLGREDDAYHACALVVPEWDGSAPPDDGEEVAPTEIATDTDRPEDALVALPESDLTQQLSRLPEVNLRHDRVPAEVSPSRFFGVMIDTVLGNSPINFHEEARLLRSSPRPE